MFITEMKIKYFRGYQDAHFMFGDEPFVLLAAPNGIGKTSFIDAIEWCLTGSIGRLKNAFDSRSTNDKERKANVKGILKNKNAGENDDVFVEIKIKDGDYFHTISRSQRRDELETTGRDVTIEVDGKPNEKGDWLDTHINHNFYNYHFCDVQKSIEIQGEKRAALSEKFKQFISDYTREETVAQNLGLFIKDAELKQTDNDDKIKKVQSDIKQIQDDFEKYSSVPEHIAYPDTIIFEDENVVLEGFDVEALKQQQKTLYNCGYSHVIDILQNLIQNQKHENEISWIDTLIQLLEDKKNDIALAVRHNLSSADAEYLSSLSHKVKENEKLRLTTENILVKGNDIVAFGKSAFSNEYFEGYKSRIKILENEITSLGDDIEALTDGNKIIKTLADLLGKKEDILEYRTSLIAKDEEVRCPVCGSLEFQNCDDDNILKEASLYICRNSEKAKEKTQAKAGKEAEKKSLLEDLVKKGEEVLATQINDDKEELENLRRVQNETITFFQTRKKLYDSLNLESAIESLDDPVYLKKKRDTITQSLLSAEAVSEKTIEIKEILTVLKYPFEDINQFEVLKAKLSSMVNQRPKLISYTNDLLIKKLNALSYQIQNQELVTLNSNLAQKTAEEKELHKTKECITQTIEWANKHKDGITNLVSELRQQEYDSLGPNLFKFYKKLTRINTVENIQIVPDGGEISLVDEKGKHVVNILSNGQISVFILAYFFAGILDRGDDEKMKIYFIDDLTSCMDDVNMLSFLDLLKYMLKEKNGPMEQLFFATCDTRIEKLLRYKMDGSGIPYFPLTESIFLSQIN